jgi:tetratricopeptide (TPR) repeat protein
MTKLDAFQLRQDQLYLLKADFLLMTDKLDESLALCQKNLEPPGSSKPADPASHYDWLVRKGGILLRKGKNEDALQALTQAYNLTAQLSQNTKEAQEKVALTRMAEVLAFLGRDSEALKYFSEMKAKTGFGDRDEINDVDMDCMTRFARYCVGRGDYASASNICERIRRTRVSRNGEDCQKVIPVLYLEAVILRRQKRLPESTKLFEKVRALCLKYRLDQVDDPTYSEVVKALTAAGKS